jgi:hypothetical protein
VHGLSEAISEVSVGIVERVDGVASERDRSIKRRGGWGGGGERERIDIQEAVEHDQQFPLLSAADKDREREREGQEGDGGERERVRGDRRDM